MSDAMHNDEMAALYAADALAPDELQAFEQHLANCSQCQEEVDSLREAATALSQADPVRPPARLRSAVLAQIANTPQQHPQDPDSPKAAEPGQADLLPYPRHARLTGWRRTPYLVAAIAVVLALVGGIWGWQTHRSAVTANDQTQLISRLLSAPDSMSRSAQMAGGGSGVVIISDRQHQAVFVGTDLPVPTKDRVYQLWTIAGAPRSAGLITSRKSTVVVTLPPAALTAATVAITIEPHGGSPSPTGKTVMAFHLS